MAAETFNISTVAAFVAAGAGVRVAKHGNRAVTSAAGCGSVDLLDSLGIPIPTSPEETARAIREVGIGFLFAPAMHTAMKHAAPVRAELRLRTAFNLLGPLTNPAGATAQLVGAPSESAAELLAGALAALGLKRGFVVHGSDGLDEITTTGPTLVFEIREGSVERRTIEPADFAVRTATSEELRGGGKARNCEIARAVLGGERGAPRDIVIANASAALVAAGLRRNLSRRHGDRGGVDRFRGGIAQSRSAPGGLSIRSDSATVANKLRPEILIDSIVVSEVQNCPFVVSLRHGHQENKTRIDGPEKDREEREQTVERRRVDSEGHRSRSQERKDNRTGPHQDLPRHTKRSK